MIATKASRSVQAAAGRPLVDFSLRRTQGRDAGLKVARASYLAGFSGTSNVLAGKLYGIPIFGTMAHSYITSFPHEIDAFRVFARNFPTIATLLIDTYDNISGARHAVTVAKEMEARGQRLDFVRLDSGDMAAISQEVRRILDDHGLGLRAHPGQRQFRRVQNRPGAGRRGPDRRLCRGHQNGGLGGRPVLRHRL